MSTAPNNIKCITFDLDDTLWDCYPVILKAEQKFYEWMDSQYSAISNDFDIKGLIRHRQQFFAQFPDMQHDFTWLRKEWLSHIATEYGYPRDFAEEGFHVFWKARNEVTLFDGVLDVLSHVNQNYQVVSITNGNADVHQAGIGEYFHFSVSASSAGVAKPDPLIFAKALELTGVSPEQTIHIGDDPVRDIQGAAAVGMKTIWANLSNNPWPGGTKPDAEINQIDQLIPTLESF